MEAIKGWVRLLWEIIFPLIQLCIQFKIQIYYQVEIILYPLIKCLMIFFSFDIKIFFLC